MHGTFLIQVNYNKHCSTSYLLSQSMLNFYSNDFLKMLCILSHIFLYSQYSHEVDRDRFSITRRLRIRENTTVGSQIING